MQIRHARPGDEAQLAALLEDQERHYGREILDGAGAPGAAFLIEPPAGGPMCLVADAAGKLGGFVILSPISPRRSWRTACI